MVALIATSSATAQQTNSTVRVGMPAVFHNGEIYHVGDSFGYNAYIFDKATKAERTARSVKFFLVGYHRTIKLPARRYRGYFWTGSVRLPRGILGRAHVLARVVVGARVISGRSYWFTIKPRVVAVEVAKASATGDLASAVASGTIRRPADGYVYASVDTKPSQSVAMNWTVACVRGTTSATKSGSARDGGPGTDSGNFVLRTVYMSLANADSCTISFGAQLSGYGSLKIDVLGNVWP
jgi:hypothetical protein